jgi:hypothetical protein
MWMFGLTHNSDVNNKKQQKQQHQSKTMKSYQPTLQDHLVVANMVKTAETQHESGESGESGHRTSSHETRTISPSSVVADDENTHPSTLKMEGSSVSKGVMIDVDVVSNASSSDADGDDTLVTVQTRKKPCGCTKKEVARLRDVELNDRGEYVIRPNGAEPTNQCCMMETFNWIGSCLCCHGF